MGDFTRDMDKIFLNLENIREKINSELRPKTKNTEKRKTNAAAANHAHKDVGTTATAGPDL